MANVACCKYGGCLARSSSDQSVGHLQAIFSRVLLDQGEREVTHGFIQGNNPKAAL